MFLGAGPDCKDLERVLERQASVQGDVCKFSFPRSDLAVTVGDVGVRPALALGSWAAFSHGMAMGDLVLLEPEVNPVISALQAGAIEQSALHNHLSGESPRVMYLHFHGRGEAVKMAETLRSALARTKTPPASPPTSAPVDLPVADLNRIIGFAGKANGGVFQFTVPRAEKITEHAMQVPPSMGVATAINFQPLGNGRAAIAGDFVMTAGEVNPVIRALRAGGVAVTALHSHMLEESPRLFFMHFWATGDARQLATTLRSALDRMHVAKSTK